MHLLTFFFPSNLLCNVKCGDRQHNLSLLSMEEQMHLREFQIDTFYMSCKDKSNFDKNQMLMMQYIIILFNHEKGQIYLK